MKNIQLFINAKEQNRLSHLYLITGKKSLNKINLALEAAYIILKDYDTRDNLKEVIKNKEHTQIFHVSPDGSSIKKDQILSLQEKFSKTSLVSGPRIYIIEDVDLISTQAANSLLKFMEEPENNQVYGILTTSNQQGVLPTITSRSQIIRMTESLNNISDELLKLEYDEFLSLNVEILTNNLEEALNIVNNENYVKVIRFIETYFNNFTNASFKPVISLNQSLGSVITDRDVYQMFLEMMIFNYTDLLKFNLGEESLFKYEKLVKKISSENILKDISLLREEIKRQTAYININLSVDTLMLSLKKWV